MDHRIDVTRRNAAKREHGNRSSELHEDDNDSNNDVDRNWTSNIKIYNSSQARYYLFLKQTRP